MNDLLATRYATPEMAQIWSPAGRNLREMRLWIAVMRAQRRHGVDIADAQLDDYANVANAYADPDSDYRRNYDAQLAHRETVTRHDLKARLETFDAMAGGYGKAHLGLTSCDIVENVVQSQLRDATVLLGDRALSALARLARLAREHAAVPLVGRTHNQPAQLVTVGRRFAVCADELMTAYGRLGWCVAHARHRGLGGAVGTQADLAAVLGGEDFDADDFTAVNGVERTAVESLGLNPLDVAIAAGQNYPRSWDLDLAGAVLQLCAAPASLAVTLRLMSGHGLVSEAPTAGQVGSSAMPHKRNPRFCERIAGLQTLVRAYHLAIAETCGTTWNEGDVSDSVTRRVALPGLFHAADGLLRTFCHVLDRIEINTARARSEVRRCAPELATGAILAAAVRAGVPRELAHEKLRTAYDGPYGSTANLAEKIAAALPPLTSHEVQTLFERAGSPDAAGFSLAQIDAVCYTVGRLLGQNPDPAGWDPGELL